MSFTHASQMWDMHRSPLTSYGKYFKAHDFSAYAKIVSNFS